MSSGFLDNMVGWATSFINAIPDNTPMLVIAAIGITAIIGRLAFGVVKRFTGR